MKNNYFVSLASLLLASMIVSCGNPSSDNTYTTKDKVKDAAKELINNSVEDNLKLHSDDLNFSLETQQGNEKIKTNKVSLSNAKYELEYDIANNSYQSYGEILGNLSIFENTYDRIDRVDIETNETKTSLNEKIMYENDALYFHLSKDVLDIIDNENTYTNGLDLTLDNVSELFNNIISSYIGNEAFEGFSNVSNIMDFVNINPTKILSNFLDEDKAYAKYLTYAIVEDDKYSINLSLNDKSIYSLIQTYGKDKADLIKSALEFSNNTKISLDIEFTPEIISAIDVNIDIGFTYLAKLFKTNIKFDSRLLVSPLDGDMKKFDPLTEYKTFDDLNIDVQKVLTDSIDTYLPFVKTIGDMIKEL